MGFRSGAYARVWEVKTKSDKCVEVRLSISHKNKDGGDYIQDFSGRVRFCGTATANKAAKLKSKDIIKLGDVDVTTTYDKDTKTTYYNFAVFSFDIADGKPNKSSSKKESKPKVEEPIEDNDNDLPF